MNYVGDYPTGATVRFMFATNLATGARADPNSALEAADVRVYKDGSTTERSSTAGFTVTSTYDSMTGITFVAIDTSDNTDAGFFAAGSDYHVVLYPDETVDSVLVSYPIGHFSIDNRKLLRPATATRQLVVDANGLADANMVKAGPTGSGTAQTARDLGASVIAASVAAGGINNASFNADVGSTAIATNIIGIASKKGTVDALNVDTYAEPAQGAPAATASFVTKLGYLYKHWRNKKTQTATTWSLLNDDAVTVDHKATVADDGTTASKGEVASGP